MHNHHLQPSEFSSNKPLTRLEKWKFRFACLIICVWIASFFVSPILGVLLGWYLVLGSVPGSGKTGGQDDAVQNQIFRRGRYIPSSGLPRPQYRTRDETPGRPLINYWGRWFTLGFRPQWTSIRHLRLQTGVLYFAVVLAGGLLFRFSGSGPYAAHKLLEGIEGKWVIYLALVLVYLHSQRSRLLPGIAPDVSHRVALILMLVLLCAYLFFPLDLVRR